MKGDIRIDETLARDMRVVSVTNDRIVLSHWRTGEIVFEAVSDNDGNPYLNATLVLKEEQR